MHLWLLKVYNCCLEREWFRGKETVVQSKCLRFQALMNSYVPPLRIAAAACLEHRQRISKSRPLLYTTLQLPTSAPALLQTLIRHQSGQISLAGPSAGPNTRRRHEFS